MRDTFASEKTEVSNNIILNALINAGVSAAFSLAGIKVNELLNNSLKGFNAGIDWDRFYASDWMKGSTLNSQKYHDQMRIIKSMGIEAIDRSGEISLEIASQAISSIVDIIKNIFSEDDIEEKLVDGNKE